MKAQNRKCTALAALTHEALQRETFDNLADLSEAVKARAARLRIPYNATAVTDALRTVAYTRRLVVR